MQNIIAYFSVAERDKAFKAALRLPYQLYYANAESGEIKNNWVWKQEVEWP